MSQWILHKELELEGTSRGGDLAKKVTESPYCGHTKEFKENNKHPEMNVFLVYKRFIPVYCQLFTETGKFIHHIQDEVIYDYHCMAGYPNIRVILLQYLQ